MVQFVALQLQMNVEMSIEIQETNNQIHTIYIGDPQSVAAIFPSCRNRAKPKSAIFSTIFDGAGNALPQLWANKMFCGFKSRCMIPLLCRASIAPANKFKKKNQNGREWVKTPINRIKTIRQKKNAPTIRKLCGMFKFSHYHKCQRRESLTKLT